MEQELGRQVCALGIVLLPSYILGEPRNEPGHKQEDEMEYYIAKQNQDSLPPVLSWPGTWRMNGSRRTQTVSKQLSPSCFPCALCWRGRGAVAGHSLLPQLSSVPVESFLLQTQPRTSSSWSSAFWGTSKWEVSETQKSAGERRALTQLYLLRRVLGVTGWDKGLCFFKQDGPSKPSCCWAGGVSRNFPVRAQAVQCK